MHLKDVKREKKSEKKDAHRCPEKGMQPRIYIDRRLFEKSNIALRLNLT